LAWVRGVLLFVGLMFAALPVGSALADTTVGQTGTPPSDFESGFEFVLASAAMRRVPRVSTTKGCPMSSALALARLEACRVLFE